MKLEMITKHVKHLFMLVLCLISLNSLASVVGVPNSDSCGLEADGKTFVVGDTTICPQDAGVKGLFEMFPSLTIEVIESLQLKYGAEIVEVLSADPITVEQRRVEVIGFHIKDLLTPLTLIVIGWTIFQIIVTKAGGKGNDATTENDNGGVNIKKTILFFTFAGFMYVPVGNFYLYQYATIIAAIAGLGASNFVISWIVYLYADMTDGDSPSTDIIYEKTSNLESQTVKDFVHSDAQLSAMGSQPDISTGDTNGVKLQEYSGASDGLLLAENEVDLAVCIVQLVNRDMLRLNQYTFARTPVIDSFGFSDDNDQIQTPVELVEDTGKSTINYGSGVQKRSWYELYDRFTDWATGRDPQLCGIETIRFDPSVSEKVLGSGATLNHEKVKPLLEEMVLEKLGSLEVNKPSDLTDISAISQSIHSNLMQAVRSPTGNNKYRIETFNKSIKVADNIRRLNCLTGDLSTSYKDGLESLSKLSDESYEFDLSCVTNIHFHKIRNLVIPEVGNPEMMYTEDQLSDEVKIEAIIQNLKRQINKDISVIAGAHKEHIEPIINSYLESRYLKNNNDLHDILKRARQGGIAMFAANFTNMSLYAEEFLKSSAPYQMLLPDVGIRFLDDKMLPNVDDDNPGVGQIRTLGYDFNVERSDRYLSSDFKVDIGRLASLREYDEQLVAQSSEGVVGEFLGGVVDSLAILSQTTGLGYSERIFAGSTFYKDHLMDGKDINQIKSEFVFSCLSGRYLNEDLGSSYKFNYSMLEQCQMLQSHPTKVISSLGVSMFNTGASLIQYTMIASGVLGEIMKLDITPNAFGKVESNDKPEVGDEDAKDGNSGKKENPTSKALKKLQGMGGFIAGFEPYVYGIGLILVVLGAIFAWLVPLVPAIIAGSIYVLWLLSVAIGVIGGPILLLFAFTPRMNASQGHSSDGAWYKLILQIMLKLPLLVVSIAFVYIACDVSMKISMFIVNIFWQDVSSQDLGTLVYCTLVAVMIVASMYLYAKIYLTMQSKISELTSLILKYAELGAHSTQSSLASYGHTLIMGYLSKDLTREAKERGATFVGARKEIASTPRNLANYADKKFEEHLEAVELKNQKAAQSKSGGKSDEQQAEEQSHQRQVQQNQDADNAERDSKDAAEQKGKQQADEDAALESEGRRQRAETEKLEAKELERQRKAHEESERLKREKEDKE